MQGPTYKFFITDTVGKSYFVDNGLVQLSTTPTSLMYDPDGWKGIGVQNNRSSKYFALDRSLTVPLAFVEDGAQILRHLFLRYGSIAKANLVILEQTLEIDDETYGFVYKSFYRGQIDFSQNFNAQDEKVTCNVIEGGLAKFIKNKENTKVEIPINVPEARLIRHEGIFLKEKNNFIIQSGLMAGDHLIGTLFINKEGQSTGLGAFTVYASTEGVDFGSSINYFLAAGSDVNNINLKGSIRYKVNSSFNGNYTITIKTSTGRTIPVFTIDPSVDQTVDIPLNVTFNLASNEKAFLYHDVPVASAIIYEETKIDVSFKNKYQTTYYQALPPIYVFKKLISELSEGQFEAASPLLEKWNNLPMTCGDAIRGIPGAKLITTISEFFDGYNLPFDIGLGIKNNKAYIDLKENFLDYEDFIDLGEVKDLKWGPVTEYSYSAIKIGYREQTYDDVNGKYEFNNTHEYSTPIDTLNKSLDMISPYRSDPYGIEYVRINMEGKTTTDNAADNDIFIIHTQDKPTGLFKSYALDRSLNASASGVPEIQTAFNLFLSPKQCLLRKERFIHSLFFRADDQLLKFQTTPKNSDLVIGAVAEKSNVLIGSLAKRLFDPFLFEFETRTPVDLIALLDANPLKTFRFTYQGNVFKGIPVKVSIEPETLQSQQYQLYSDPANDLMLLENIAS